MLKIGLRHRAVVESKLFAILDGPKSIHADEVPAIRDSDDCPAVGIAGVGEPG